MSTPIGPMMLVAVDYVLRDEEGNTLDASTSDTPLEYIQGRGHLLGAVEQALEGKVSGDAVSVTVAPDDGYGERDPERLLRAPRSQFDFDPQPGMVVRAELPDGNNYPFVIADVDEEHVVLDGNHPLAGMTLDFEFKIVAVRQATDDDIARLS